MDDLHLVQLRLRNFCNFEDHLFDFRKDDGLPFKYICLFGPNGVGKSTLLEAIAMLTMNVAGRNMQYVRQSLQKYVRNTDYDPTYNQIGKMPGEEEIDNPQMLIEGIYEMDGQKYTVQITENGWIRNDLAPVDEMNTGPWGEEHLRYRQRVCHFIMSDSDLSLHKFQLQVSQKEAFEIIISEIMRWPAHCVNPPGLDRQGDDLSYCTDFIIEKKGHRIHFKRMSAGERKICKSFSELLNLMSTLSYPMPGEPAMDGWPRLLLIDNAVMHVYYDRHVRMIDCLKQVFNRQQIFATTHSGMLIKRFLDGKNDQENELMIDLEPING